MAKKSKAEIKQMLLAKGEYIALGASGLFLVILLGWGIAHWSSAKDPVARAEVLNRQAQSVQNKILDQNVSPEDLRDIPHPAWLTERPKFGSVPTDHFAIVGPQFDPIAKPDTKKENPIVHTIGAYQVDLVRCSMPGYDIIYDNEGRAQIAMVTSKTVSDADKAKRKEMEKTIRNRGAQGASASIRNQNQNNVGPMGPPGPMGGGPGPMGGGPGPMGGGPGPMGGGPGPMGPRPPGVGGMTGVNPHGLASSGGYDQGAQRIEKDVVYVPLDEIDKAIENGKVPAFTVIPLRMVTIHAEVPYKRQVEEIRRALRLPSNLEAQKWGPMYDGYEIQRRVTRYQLGKAEPDVIQDWSEYKFEDKYVELINSRKLADNVEDGYLSHFIRYDMALALPLPQLVPELGTYPSIRLDAINATIRKLREANTKPVTPSDLKKRLDGRPPREDLYKPQSAETTGASAVGANNVGGFQIPPGGKPMGPGGPGPGPMGGGPGPMGGGPGPMGGGTSLRPGDAGNQDVAPPIEIDNLLLRFVDVDVKPGYTYEYRVRLRMLNPNFGLTKEVANPAFAKVKEMYSQWAQIADTITVPTEAFLYAVDPAAFRKKIEDEYAKEKDLRDRLQAKDNQVVVEMCSWLEQVRTDTGRGREPVGAWVVADMPVGRGEYVGRKQYLKLPLWSSKENQYVLREIPATAIVAKKDVAQPRGWLVDFTTKSILVDFDGGKVVTRTASGKTITEDVAAELLIVRPDGKLLVKNSLLDEADANRKEIVGGWEKWIKEVAKREVKETGGNDNPFEKK